MKHAILDGTTIVQVIRANYTPASPWIQVPDAAEVGGDWDGSTYTPVTVGPNPNRLWVTPREFLALLTDAELQAVLTAAKSSVAIEAWKIRLEAARNIDLTFAETIAGVNALEASGLIGPGRAAEILAGVPE